jgi:hypothetical protein
MNAPELKKLGEEFLKRLVVTWIGPDVAFVAERPEGPAVSLQSWRKQLTDARRNSVGQPGIYLDRSPTGAGKSFADKAAIERSGCGLIVTPTHEQCGEILADLRAADFKAVAFPARTTQGDSPNCWNEEADAAQTLGFPVVATVCGRCRHRETCCGDKPGPGGYLAAVVRAEAANVVVATHKRIEAAGLDPMSGKWPFVSIHEDAIDVLFPSFAVSRNSIVIAQKVVRHVLESPRWLDWLGETESRDDDGKLVPDLAKAERREAQDAFLRHLDDSITMLAGSIHKATQATELPDFAAMQKPSGIEWLLWQAQKELGLAFDGESPWRAILTLVSDTCCRAGVVVTESNETRSGNNGQNTDCDSQKSATSRRNSLAG